jgi:hypothetical protein
MLIKEIYFLPPLAIARLGESETPLDCFVWDTDISVHGGNRTVIKPAVSLRVMANGSVRPFKPEVIQFRDGPDLRPVAPFFELWATVQKKDSNTWEKRQINRQLLKSLGVDLDSVQYRITVGNRKAQRRTRSAACAYIAQVLVSGDDHERKPLLAFSPNVPDEEPLVSSEHRIPLGHFQVIRPIDRLAMGVDLSALRVRFTPATGQVYGPPTAITGPASPLPPGQALDPVTLGGRLYEIVKPENRILNPYSKWSEYTMDAADQEDPQPSDSYDGANVGDSRSRGVVDDSCDGIIEAQVAIGGVRYVATARVLSSCPDFAPDRRPLNSVADDLADRDAGPVPMETDKDKEQALEEIADLFERAFETASLINLDANRYRGLNENSGNATNVSPRIDFRSMTAKDKPYADLVATFFPNSIETPENMQNLQFTDLADFRHEELCDIEVLLDFFQDRPDHVEMLVRPPFGRLRQLRAQAPATPNPSFRDPRLTRDQLHDMRMPPYMRDSDALPLSITRRQYEVLIELLGEAKKKKLKLKSPVERLSEQLEQRKSGSPAGSTAGRKKGDGNET